MALKHTKVELDLTENEDMYRMVKSGIRGGISTISNRYSRANNPLVEGYDSLKPTTFIHTLMPTTSTVPRNPNPYPWVTSGFSPRKKFVNWTSTVCRKIRLRVT